MEPLPDFLQPLLVMKPPFPREAMEAAIARREESIPHLLHSLEWVEANAREVDENDPSYSLHIYALYLLAQFREPRAYPLVVRLFRNPLYYELTGDVCTESLPNILASIYGGDLAPIHALAEDAAADEFVRGSALRALGVLVDCGMMTREELSAYLGSFFARRAADEAPGSFWDNAIHLCAIYRLAEHLEIIRALYRDEIAEPAFDSLEGIEREIVLPPGEGRRGIPRRTENLVESAIDELQGWWCFNPKSLEEGSGRSGGESYDPLGYGGSYLPAEPYVRTEPKIGRNDPCPCGSGRKFKKCCGAA